jgi:hypothetical protein
MKYSKTIFRPDPGLLSGGGWLNLVPRSRNHGVVSPLPHTSSELKNSDNNILDSKRNQLSHFGYVISLLSLFWKKKKMEVGLCDLHAVCVSPHNQIWTTEPIFMKHCMYIIAPELISTAYFINPSHQSVCLHMYPSFVARQRLGKTFTATVNIRNNKRTVYSVVSYAVRVVLRKVGD